MTNIHATDQSQQTRHTFPAVDIENVSHVFLQQNRPVPVLDHVSLTVGKGEFVSIVGPSGCGKTTIMGLVAGLLVPAAGKVSVDGNPVLGPNRRVAYMLARDALLPWKSAIQNVELGLLVRNIPRHERREIALRWLERVGLLGFESARITELSQGMRQRIALARTLCLSPQCILMDEPFAALDAQTRFVLQREFLDVWERVNASVIFVTHDLGEAILLSDKVVLLSERPGRVQAIQTIDFPRPRHLDDLIATERYQSYHAELRRGLRDTDNAPKGGATNGK